MADWYGGMNNSRNGGGNGNGNGNGRRSVVLKDDPDFAEAEIWSSVNNQSEDYSKEYYYSSSSSSSSGFSTSAWHFPATAKKIPKARINIQSSTDYESTKNKLQQSSAPVNIPDWSKIYGKNVQFNPSSSSSRSRTGSWVDQDHDHGHGHGHNHHHHGNRVLQNEGSKYDDDGDGDDDDGMVPPHEWLAKKLARSQISSFSVCEGIGRTLKGRDLSKVRNTILTKTGFLE